MEENFISDTLKNIDSKQLHTLSLRKEVDKNEIYNQWANSYDEYVNSYEYNAPIELVNLINTYRTSFYSNLTVLDFGCGTGLLGDAFVKIFHTYNTNLVGIDISEKMIDKSRERNIYSHLICKDITKISNLDNIKSVVHLSNNRYDLVMSCGVFLEGHVDLNFVDNVLIKLVKPGGIVAFTVRNSFLDKSVNFLERLLANTEIKLLSKTKINYLKDVNAWGIVLRCL